LRQGDQLTVGAHLSATEFKPDGGGIKRGIQLVADIVFVTARERR
jgi:hypothetical protein